MSKKLSAAQIAAAKAAAKADEIAKAKAEAAAAAEAKAKKSADKADQNAAATAAEKQAKFRQEKRDNAEKFREEYKALMFHNCTITKGKHKGKSGAVAWIGANKWRISEPMVRLVDGGVSYWVHPNHLEKGNKLPSVQIEVMKAEEKERAEGTLYIVGTATKETDTGVVLSCKDWFRRLAFAKSDVTKVGTYGDLDVFEVPTWKIRNELGNGMVTFHEGQADEIVANMVS